MTIPYADEIERMWARGKAVRRAHAEHLDHLRTGRQYLRGCACGYCSRDRELARLRFKRRKESK